MLCRDSVRTGPSRGTTLVPAPAAKARWDLTTVYDKLEPRPRASVLPLRRQQPTPRAKRVIPLASVATLARSTPFPSRIGS